ncbi:MAG: transporter substrate-binding protein [Pseudonocardiales bacterium]|nr:transporter substrate-binding protein [Pseudonocardiales bacterium]
MTALVESHATTDESVEPGPVKADIAGTVGSNGGRLLKFALANLRRRPEQFALSTLGIALAITAVIVVRTISIGFAGSGSASLGDVLHGAPLWVLPSQGIHYDAQLGALLPDGPAPQLTVPDGWTAQRTIAGVWTSPAGRVAVNGRSDVAAGTAVMGSAAAKLLGVRPGSRLELAGVSVTVAVDGTSRIVSLPTPVAAGLVGSSSWWTVREPASLSGRLDLGKLLSAATGIPSSTNPANKPPASGLIYDTVGGGGSVTFQQRFSALFAGKVTGSVLGMVSTVGLLLGFVIAVTSFLASVQERRREFGIMASIGLADEVLYFFLVESAVVFVIAYLAAALLAGIAVFTLVPGVASMSAWLQACGMAAAYLPAMAIIGALVPVHRLLQQRPVALLAESA